jgi:hypothetical protein
MLKTGKKKKKIRIFTGEQHGDARGVQGVVVFHAVAKSNIANHIQLQIRSSTTNLKNTTKKRM